MKKLLLIVAESWSLVKKHKLYFLLPILLTLALLAFLVYQLGPAAVVTFIYAGL